VGLRRNVLHAAKNDDVVVEAVALSVSFFIIEREKTSHKIYICS